MRLIGVALLISGGTLIFFVLRATAAPSPSVSSASSSPGASSGGSGGGSTSLWNVPILGPDGTQGSIQVVAHDAASAVENAHQGGNTPIGAAVSILGRGQST